MRLQTVPVQIGGVGRIRPTPASWSGTAAIKHVAAASAVLYFYHVCTLWIFDEDRPHHLYALITGAHKAREPLWGFIAPYFGYLFPERAFEALVLVSASLFYFAIARLTRSASLTILIMVSLGMIGLINEATRQALGMSIFCLAMTIDRPRIRWPLILATGLIHTVLFGAALYVFGMAVSDRFGRRDLRWDMLGWALLLSCGIFVVGFVAQRLTETAMALFALQMVAVLALNYWKVGAAELTKVVLAFTIASASFVWTPTGLRGVYLVGVLAPFVLRRNGMLIATLCLWVYPILVGDYGTFLLALSHLPDAMGF